MAASSLIHITLFSLALVTSLTEARMALGQYNNRQGVAKNEAIVETIQHLMPGKSIFLSSKKSDFHTSNDKKNQKAFVRDFEPRPDTTAYPDGDAGLKVAEEKFMNNFEPRPDATAYPADDAGFKVAEKKFVKDFEPRQDASAYPDDDAGLKEIEKKFVKDFKPRPDVTAYPADDAGLKAGEKKFVKDFEPRPDVTA